MAKRDLPVRKNDIVTVEAVDLSVNGEGIGRYLGYTLFVPGMLPGEEAHVKVLKTGKSFGFGKVEKLVKASPERVEPLCPVFGKCGGCSLQHLSYEGQLSYKRSKVQAAMERIGGFEGLDVLPAIGASDPWHYRNKVQYPVREEHGELKIGYYAKNSHRIVETPVCYIQSRDNETIVGVVRRWMERHGIAGYNELLHKGVVRHLLIRRSGLHRSYHVTLVCRKEKVPFIDELIHAFEHLDSVKVTGLCVNVNKEKTNVILGEKTVCVWGEPDFEDAIGDVKFRISPQSFYQVNPEQTLKLYEKAVEYAALGSDDTVVEAYCGIGTITLFLAQKAKSVVGVEIVEKAVEDARKNAELNGMENVAFYAGEAETVIPELYESEGLKADVVVVDPPRKGCEEALLDTIVAMAPKRLVYVSCDPATLARDCKYLAEIGFSVVEVQPVDMFPMTGHVETVVRLVRE